MRFWKELCAGFQFRPEQASPAGAWDFSIRRHMPVLLVDGLMRKFIRSVAVSLRATLDILFFSGNRDPEN
jgi:hypothetical protein